MKLNYKKMDLMEKKVVQNLSRATRRRRRSRRATRRRSRRLTRMRMMTKMRQKRVVAVEANPPMSVWQ